MGQRAGKQGVEGEGALLQAFLFCASTNPTTAVLLLHLFFFKAECMCKKPLFLGGKALKRLIFSHDM